MGLFHGDLLPPTVHAALPGQTGALRTISFAVGLAAGLVTVVDTQSGAGGRGRHATVDWIDRRLGELHVAPSAPQLHDKDRDRQRLYDEITRRADPMLRPLALQRSS
jgi:hypothetical protein